MCPCVRLAAKPLGSDQHSMNEIHDNRAVTNDVNIHVAGSFPVEKTARPLEWPKMADVIRNTSSYAGISARSLFASDSAYCGMRDSQA
jgi:hypothetical protein